LGLLPLASGTGIFLLLGTDFFTQQAAFLLPIGLLGVGATCALFSLELRGIQKCHALIEAGKEIEEKHSLMDLPYHFTRKPPPLQLKENGGWVIKMMYALAEVHQAPSKGSAAQDGDKERSRTDAGEGALGIDAALAAQVMYPSVLSAWLFVALVGIINIAFGVVRFHEASSEGDVTSAAMVLLAVPFALLFFRTLFRETGELLKEID
jgi:hypothetical protein